MTPYQHDAVVARLSDYVLGHASPDERRDIEAHVRECSQCALQLQDLLLVFEGLARAPQAMVPPAELKQRVLARLAQEPQEPSSAVAPSADVTLHDRKARRGFVAAWLAAAAVLVVAAGVALYFSIERERRLASELARIEADFTKLQQELGDNAAQADMVLSILTAADMRRIDLASADRASAARAYWSPTRGLLVAADHLPVPPPGRVFQVWLIGPAGGPVSAGLLGPRAGGRGMLIAPPPGGIASGPVTIAITDEPPGGLSSPTGGKHLVGSL